MTRDSGHILETIAEAVLNDHVPKDGNLYDVSNLVLASRMMAMAAADLDRAADNLIRENDSIKALFQAAITAVEDDALGKRLADAAIADANDFKVSSLRAFNNQLCEVLIDLHAHVEKRHDAAAIELNRKIWQILCAGAEQNMLPWFS